MNINKTLLLILVCSVIVSCKKDNSEDAPASSVTSTQVLNDFADVLAYPNYQDITNKAASLKAAVQTLTTSQTDQHLTDARNSWKETRGAWELCEAFLFGPVEDFNYDPAMDDWPVNKNDMDSLLASSNPLTLAEIDALPTSLKGFHPIEYILFGTGGVKTAADITPREMQYLQSLTESLYNTTVSLRDHWNPSLPGNYSNELKTAGAGSTRFATRKDAFITIANAMAGICDEVANGKMEEPLAAQDSTLQESQFSHNSTLDFRNNITGVWNAYTCKYLNDGKGFNELVAAKNISLDNKLQSQMNAAIQAFNAIDNNYGIAIYTQQVQIHNAQDAINTLKETIETDLANFIQVNIKD